MKILNFLFVVLVVLASSIGAYSNALKLFPQITDGIYNQNGILTMKCVIGKDGLTVTDEAWDTYSVPGYKKRWTLNMGQPMTVPLKNYRFNDKFSGLPVDITVEFYSEEKPWVVVENYQEILQLGGNQQIGLPKWFHIPTNRLGYDFDEGTWFPRGWSVPKGKFACWQGAAKVYQKDRNGRHPLFDYGFNYIAQCAQTHGGAPISRGKQCQLFGDNEWMKMENNTFIDPTSPKNWMIEPWMDHARTSKIAVVDFEACRSDLWGDSQFQAFSKMVNEVRSKYPDVYFGCWGVGSSKSSFRIFDSFYDGRPTGVVDLNGAKQWADMYNNPQSQINNAFEKTSVNFSNPSVYYINNSKPSQLYAFLQEWEISKKLHPNVPNVLSSWIQVEFVDGYPLSSYKFKDSKGIDRVEMLKHQVPASSMYALSLFAHTVMDGLYSWEIGNRYSENLNDYADTWHGETPVTRNVNGVNTSMFYYVKYFGFYNYLALGMWQASQHKDIIEADTKWEMPDIWTDRNRSWRVGDVRYPSFVNYYKEPLVRVKLSKDGRSLLVVADNPYNMDVEKVKIRLPGRKQEFTFELVGDFPVIQTFKVPM